MKRTEEISKKEKEKLIFDIKNSGFSYDEIAKKSGYGLSVISHVSAGDYKINKSLKSTIDTALMLLERERSAKLPSNSEMTEEQFIFQMRILFRKLPVEKRESILTAAHLIGIVI